MAANENVLTQPKFEPGITGTRCVSGRFDHKTKKMKKFTKFTKKKILFSMRGGAWVGGGSPPWKIPWK